MERHFIINGDNSDQKFCNNAVINSKYTIFTFLPLILFYHCKRFMNAYFIIIGLLQIWKNVSPVDPLTTWIPILVIFSITFFREGIDDYKQHVRDRKINSRLYQAIHNKSFGSINSQNLQVGDIIFLNDNDECPADIVLLAPSNFDGSISIETSTLDGETSLKNVESPRIKLFRNSSVDSISESYRRDSCSSVNSITGNSNAVDLLKSFSCSVTCNNPTNEIFYFNGHLEFSDGSILELSSDNFIPSGARISCEDQIFGFVCYTGKDSKLCLNQMLPVIKWTKIEKFLSKTTIAIFISQVILSLIFGLISHFYEVKKASKLYYLRFDLGQDLPDSFTFVISIVRVYLLTTSMIPISLKLTIDLCKFIYGSLISHDLQITEEITKRNAIVNNSSVIEDLGSIEYMFCDKTGTLTENKMKFKKIGIDGQYFGYSKDYDDIGQDEIFKNSLRENNQTVLYIIYCLIICNTVKIRPNNEIYGTSPEEISFIKKLRKLHFQIEVETVFCNYSLDELSSNDFDIDNSNNNNSNQIIAKGLCTRYTIWNEEFNVPKKSFEVVKSIPFSHYRKRMSVIVRDVSENADDQYFLFMKGGSDILKEICKPVYNDYVSQVDCLASQGLRIMGVAYKILDKEVVDDYLYRSLEYKSSSDQLDNLSLTIESESNLIGCVAVEDKLQERVPRTIKQLSRAGIKIWMITGDIFQTALKISYSTGLVQESEVFIKISVPNNYSFNLKDVLDNVESYTNSIISSGHSYYIGIDDYYDEIINDKENREKFVKIALNAKSVICARSTPKVKNEIVKLIMNETGKATLAIGDGGNDVSMIRTADVGIGIYGMKGLFASNASDISITKFYFLERLLLIHGRYSYYRTSWLTQFCFYKSCFLCLIQVIYMFVNCFSGASYFSAFNLMCYNAIFTILPVIFFLQDKDLEESTVLLHPEVYEDSQKFSFCNVKTMILWFLRGIYQAVAISVLSFNVFNKFYINTIDGAAATLDEAQQVTYSAIMFVIIMTVFFDTQNFTVLNMIFIWGNWVVYVTLTIIANCVFNIDIVKEVYMVMWRILANPINWIIMITMGSIAFFPPYFIQSIAFNYSPSNSQFLRILEIQKESKFLPLYFVKNSNENIEDQISV